LKESLTESPAKLPNPGPDLRRGDVWWVRLDPTAGSEIRKTRPCLIITANLVNQHRRTAVVIPLSSSPSASPPLLVPITCAGKAAVAVMDQVRAVAKERFVERMGAASLQDMEAVESGLRQILEL